MAWLDGKNTVTQAALDRDVERAVGVLRRRDGVLGAIIDEHGPCRLEATTNYFQVLLETVVSQQLSTKAARSIYGRLVANVGNRSIRPKDILNASDGELRGAGLSRSKSEYVRNVAAAFSSRRMGPRTLGRLSNEEVVERLTRIKGIGDWSAHMFLIFALCRLDVFPFGDLGLRNAIARNYGLRKSASMRRYQSIGEVWRPYRTVGTMYLWMSYDN